MLSRLLARFPFRRKQTLFTLAGFAAGLAWYYFVGCASGTCVITATPIHSMLYWGLIGWLLSNPLTPSKNKGANDSCRT